MSSGAPGYLEPTLAHAEAVRHVALFELRAKIYQVEDRLYCLVPLFQ